MTESKCERLLSRSEIEVLYCYAKNNPSVSFELLLRFSERYPDVLRELVGSIRLREKLEKEYE